MCIRDSEDYEETKFQEKSTIVADTYVQAEQLRASSTSFMLFTFLFSIGLILFFGGRSVINGNMTPGELAQFIFYLQILSMPVRMMALLFNAYARAASAGERLFAILDSESPVKEKQDAEVMSDVKGHVVFDNVSLEYENGKKVLDGINIEANPGEAPLEKLKTFRKLGINRLSIGFQSLHPELLKFLTRIHTGEQAIQTFHHAREAGFENINVDLIFSIPNQSLSMLEKDLEVIT